MILKALAVEGPSLLAVLMKNVALSSFTQSELVELCQRAGGSWGMREQVQHHRPQGDALRDLERPEAGAGGCPCCHRGW